MKAREVITYKDYFDDFFKAQTQKVRDKIIKILRPYRTSGTDSFYILEVYRRHKRTF